MRWMRMSRKGEARDGRDKAAALCIGGHGAGNNSQMDLIVFIYEKKPCADGLRRTAP